MTGGPARAGSARSTQRRLCPVRRVLWLQLALLCAACSPKYDWREIRSPEAGWTAMLPGKQAAATRDITLGDMPVKMAMQGARVDDTAFTVASAALPDAQPATGARALAAMREALVRNIGGRETAASEVTAPLIDASGRRIGQTPGVQVAAAGQVRGRPATMIARLYVHRARAVQALVVGPEIDREQADQFFESLRLHD